MDPNYPQGGGGVSPSSAPSDFQTSPALTGPSPDPAGSDFTQAQQSGEMPSVINNPAPSASLASDPPPSPASSPDPMGVPSSGGFGAPPPTFTPTVSGPEAVPPAVPPQDPLLTGEPMASPPTGPSSSSGSKKTLLLVLVGLALLGTIAGAIYLASRFTPKLAEETSTSSAPTATPAPAIASAKVDYVEGTAWSISSEGRVALAEDQEVKEGALIETEEDSKLLLVLEGGSILRIGPASVVTLTSLAPEAFKFSQSAGVTYAFVDVGVVGTFTVDTGSLIVEAQGTAFSVEKNELALVNVYQSSVKAVEGDTELAVGANSQYVEGAGQVATLDTTDLEIDNFLQWALEEELARIESEILSSGTSESKESYKSALTELNIDKKELLEEAFLASNSGVVSEITLSGQKTPEGAVSLSWTTDGLAENGFRILWSGAPAKPYPGDKKTFEPLFGYAKTLGPMKPGKTWYYRVCEWVGTTCGVYSNELSFNF